MNFALLEMKFNARKVRSDINFEFAGPTPNIFYSRDLVN